MIDLQPIKDRAQKAEDEMDRLTAGNPSTNWRWSIPANPERDSDLILSASAADVRKLLPAVEAVLAASGEVAEVWKDQIGTHYNGCHVRHVGCLAALVQHTIEQALA